MLAATFALGAPALALAQGTTAQPGNAGGAAGMSTPSKQTGSMQSSTMSKDQIKNELQARGYSDIDNLDQKSDHYTADAKRYGKEEKNLHIDSHTGQISNQPKLTEDQVKNMLKKHGYSDVSDVKSQGNDFTADAKQNGQKMKLKVDAQSGVVTPQTNG